MKRSLMYMLGVVLPCLLAFTGTALVSGSAVANANSSSIRTVGADGSIEERADALGLKLKNKAVVTAPKRYALQFPKIAKASSQKAVIDLSQWSGYTFAFDDASQSLYISNANKELVGLVTDFDARDADGAIQPATASLDGSKLSLSTQLANVAEFRIDYYDATASDSSSATGTSRASLIKVPSNYVYNPKLGALHDYCTKSPDEFPNPFGKNADFRGPCAIHDMCYEKRGCASRACDATLKANLKNNCIATYSKGATRTSCIATANVYYGTVTAVHIFSSCA